jgi:hypothetical protein
MENAIYHDDSTISDDNNLWRRIHPAQIVYDNNLKSYRPSSAAFDDSSNGSPMSVILAEENRNPSTALENYEGFSMVSLTARLVRDCGQGIARDPLPDEPAHALVFGEKPKSIRKKLAQAAEWIVSPH